MSRRVPDSPVNRLPNAESFMCVKGRFERSCRTVSRGRIFIEFRCLYATTLFPARPRRWSRRPRFRVAESPSDRTSGRRLRCRRGTFFVITTLMVTPSLVCPWTIRKRLGDLLAGARVRLFGKEVEDGSG